MIIQDKLTTHSSHCKSTEQNAWKVCLITKYLGFKKEPERPKVDEIMEVPSTTQNSKAIWTKGKCTIVRDTETSSLNENLLSKNGSI